MTEAIRFLIQNGAKVKTLEGLDISDIQDIIISNHTFLELDAKEIEKLAQENNRDALKIIFTTIPNLLYKEDIIEIIVRYNCLEILLGGGLNETYHGFQEL